ncbi:lytic polysaccharide monooxygenase [Streptomyces sp. NPDC050485]
MSGTRGSGTPVFGERPAGHHIVLAVWTIADPGNAFHACSDV